MRLFEHLDFEQAVTLPGKDPTCDSDLTEVGTIIALLRAIRTH